MCMTFICVNAQPKNYNGWYRNPTQYGILKKTAITNFVNNKMLIIDTYDDPSMYRWYLVLTFIDDHFNITNQIKYLSPRPVVQINDVKYDIINDRYIACGFEDMDYINSTNNLSHFGIIMKFDNAGNELWCSDAINPNDSRYGANIYNNVEIVPTGNQYYVACGLHVDSNPIYNYGVVGFYDQITGILQYMFTPNYTFNSNYYSEYKDLVYNPINNMIALVGVYWNFPNSIPFSMLMEQIDVSTTPPTTSPLILRHDINYLSSIYTTSITIDIDPIEPSYYIAGEINSTDIYIAKVNASNFNVTNEMQYNNNYYLPGSLKVNDICYNPHTNPKNVDISQIGIVGQIYTANQPYQSKGFLLEVDTNNLSVIPNGFSAWSDISSTPNFDAYFEHIIYRDNNYAGINYSYIMYGQVPSIPNVSYLAEFYPQTNPNSNVCQEVFMGYQSSNINLSEFISDPHFIDPFENNLDLLNNESITYLHDSICEYPYYESASPYNKKSIANITQYNLIIKNGIIYLDDNYKQVVCNVISLDGKLIYSKQKDVQTISIQGLKPGMYILHPLNNINLKSLKFIVVH